MLTPGHDDAAVSLLYNPYQQAFLEARRERLDNGRRKYHRLSLFSGRRGGKTRIGALAALEEMTTPGTIGWMCAPTYPKLHDYVMPAFFAVLPKSWYRPGDYSVEHKTIKLINGSMAAFRSLDSPDAGRGPGLHWCWIDEVCEVAQGAWYALRPALTEHRGVAWFTTSPRGYDWVYQDFWRPAAEGIPGFWACKYRTIDNPIIEAAEVDEARLTMPPKVFQQEYEADFVSFEGAIYENELLDPCLLRTDEQIRRFLPEWPQIDASRPVLVGLDPGADHPFAGVVFIKTEAGLVAVSEYLERQLPAGVHVRNLRRLVGPATDVKWVVDKTQRQMMIELAAHGLYTIPAMNDQVAGIERVWAWMQTKQLGLIEARVPRLIAQLRSLVWDDKTNKDGQKRRQQQKKVNDDLADACRYGIASWPDLPKPPVVSTARSLQDIPPDLRWAWEREQRLKRGDDGLRPVDLHPIGTMYD